MKYYILFFILFISCKNSKLNYNLLNNSIDNSFNYILNFRYENFTSSKDFILNKHKNLIKIIKNERKYIINFLNNSKNINNENLLLSEMYIYNYNLKQFKLDKIVISCKKGDEIEYKKKDNSFLILDVIKNQSNQISYNESIPIIKDNELLKSSYNLVYITTLIKNNEYKLLSINFHYSEGILFSSDNYGLSK